MHLRDARRFAQRSATAVAVVAGALTAAMVAPSVAPSAAAPDDRSSRCRVPYPASVATTVLVSLERPLAVHGQRTRVAVELHSGGSSAASPGGRVRVVVVDSDGSREMTRTAAVRGGRAAVVLPPRLPARDTYTVRARYLPPRCSALAADEAPERHYTVFPRRAHERGS